MTICEGSGRLSLAKVFNAKVAGALKGLYAAVKIPNVLNNLIIVCLDNLAAAIYL